MVEKPTYTVGDVVQIVAEEHPWFGCLLVVTEPKSWGIQGFVNIPQSCAEGGDPPAAAFLRPRHDEIAYVGHIVLEMSRDE